LICISICQTAAAAAAIFMPSATCPVLPPAAYPSAALLVGAIYASTVSGSNVPGATSAGQCL
jgi:hypothetical protein